MSEGELSPDGMIVELEVRLIRRMVLMGGRG